MQSPRARKLDTPKGDAESMNRFSSAGRKAYIQVSQVSIVSAALLVTCAGAAVIAQTAATDDAKTQQDRQKVGRELKDLEEQRAKLDSRIRELRRSELRELHDSARVRAYGDANGKLHVLTAPGSGSFYFSDGNLKQMKDLTPEQRKHVEEALAEARKALEKVKGELPEGFVIPDIEGLLNNSMRMRTLAPGNVYVAPKAWDSREFREQMEKMQDTIRQNVQTWRNVAPHVWTVPPTTVVPAIPGTPGGPGVRVVPPAMRSRDNDPELRDEIRELRRELEQLRDEMRRDHGTKRDSQDRKTQFLDPFGGTL